MASPSDAQPAAVIETLPDGCVRITVAGLVGTVSSHHLVEPKVAQLRAQQQVDDRS